MVAEKSYTVSEYLVVLPHECRNILKEKHTSWNKLRLRKTKLLAGNKWLITVRIESSIISIDSNIIDNIIQKVISMYCEKCRIKNKALRNSINNWKFLQWLLNHNHSKETISEKRWNKAKYPTRISIRLEFAPQLKTNATAQLAPHLLKFQGCSTGNNCRKIYSWSRRSETTLELRKDTIFLEVINNPVI